MEERKKNSTLSDRSILILLILLVSIRVPPLVATAFLILLPLEQREFIANLRANWRHNFRGLAPYLILWIALLLLSVIIFLWFLPQIGLVDLVEQILYWRIHILWIVDFLLSTLSGLVLWFWAFALSRRPKKWTIVM